jgi:hypothetical protein
VADVSAFDGELDLHAGEMADGWQVEPRPLDDHSAEMGTAVLGETPECNGLCHAQGDYPDFDKDCPAHGGPEREVCPECGELSEIADASIETSGYEERQRDYHVTWLTCGHEIAVAVKR